MRLLEAMQKKSIFWNWEPLVSIGPFRFGEPVAPVIEKYNLRKLERVSEVADWDTYEVPDGNTVIYVEDSSIDSVACYDNLFYQGKNLLGISLEEIHEILGKEDEFGKIIGEKTPVEYESFGLQIWFRNGITVDATCYGFIDN